MIQTAFTGSISIVSAVLLTMFGETTSGLSIVTYFTELKAWDEVLFFYLVTGLSIGSCIGAIVSGKLWSDKSSFIACVIMSLVVYGLNQNYFTPNIQIVFFAQIYLLPTIIAVTGINWYLIQEKLNIV